jgi:16S rRNA (adenine1518-N6/adenine1519-N6)-dimethyltransferase
MSDSRIRPKKSLGQNFLTDPHYLGRIIAAAQVGPLDQVLEIGPGLGHLTRGLASRAGRVVVVELDDRLISELRTAFSSQTNVEIIHADALEFDPAVLPGQWKVVANLPYYIATPLIQRLIALRRKFTTLTLMLQKEVAERVAASPGGREYGLLSVLVQLHASARIVFTVPAGAFTPRPKVESAVVTLTFPPQSPFTVADEQLFVQVAKAAFGQRRKTLRNSLSRLGYTREGLESAAAQAGIDLGRRPETLTVEEFCRLTDAFSSQPTIKTAE